ncbi:MAG: ribosome recycling factor, partial [Bacteroidales bacterium]|nr:ribosome recycling factor [Bacteroidales bacterium]
EEFKKLKKEGVSEDEAKDAEQTVHKAHEDFIKKVDAVIDAKEKELMTV